MVHDELDDLNQEHDAGGGGSENGDAFAQPVQFFLKRSGGLFDGGKFLGDLAELGIIANAGDQHSACAAGYEAAGVEHAGPLCDGCVFLAGEVCGFFHREALAGEGGFVGGQVVACQQSAVGHDLVARFDEQDVADNDVFLGDQLRFTVPQDFDESVFVDLAESFKSFCALAFCHDGDCHRQEDCREDPGAFEEVVLAAGEVAGDVDRQGDDGRKDQHQEHRFRRCVPDPSGHGFAAGAEEGVGAVLFARRLDLRLVKAALRVCSGGL